MKRIIIVLLACISLVACSKSHIYSNEVQFPNQYWPRIDEGKDITFDNVVVPSKDEAYDISLTFRHTAQINIDKISFILRIISPSGIRKETTHTIDLKDRSGVKFAGQQVGDVYDMTSIVKQYFSFGEKGTYKIIISNYCTQYQVDGLISAKIDINKSNLDYDLDK